jgi:hypothetical protein
MEEPKRLLKKGGEKEQQARESEGRWIDIRDENGEIMPGVRWLIYGTLSDRYRKEQARQRDRWAKSRKDPTGDDLEKQSLELTAVCVGAWEGVVDDDDSALPCTKAEVIGMLSAYPHIRNQVDAEKADHASFFSSSSRS